MPSEVIAILMILLPFGAFLLSGRAVSRPAYWILRVGGLYFAVTMALTVIINNLCGGDLLKGLTQCLGGTEVVFRPLAPLLLLSVAALLIAGPVLLVIAAVLEALARRRGA